MKSFPRCSQEKGKFLPKTEAQPDKDTEILLPVETRGQAGLWRKKTVICVSTMAVLVSGGSEALLRVPRHSEWDLMTVSAVPIQLQFTAYPCLFTGLKTRQTLVLMVGGVKRNTSLTLPTVLGLLPILCRCQIPQKI